MAINATTAAAAKAKIIEIMNVADCKRRSPGINPKAMATAISGSVISDVFWLTLVAPSPAWLNVAERQHRGETRAGMPGDQHVRSGHRDPTANERRRFQRQRDDQRERAVCPDPAVAS